MKARQEGHPRVPAPASELVDPGSFMEIGRCCPNALHGDGVVTGHGLHQRPAGRRVLARPNRVQRHRRGDVWPRVARLMEWCVVGCPIVGINVRRRPHQDAVTSLAWYAELGLPPRLLSGLVPQSPSFWAKCAGSGVFADPDRSGGGGARPGLCSSPADVIRTSPVRTSASTAGAPTTRRATATSIRWWVSRRMQYVRDFLSFLPSNCFDKPPVVNPGLERKSPATIWNSTRSCRTQCFMAYGMRVLLRIFDDGDFLDVAAQAGQAIITGTTREVGGRTVVWWPTSHACRGDRQRRRPTRPHSSSVLATRSTSRWCSSWTHRGLGGTGKERDHQRGGGFLYAVVEADVPKVTITIRRCLRCDGVQAAGRRPEPAQAPRASRVGTDRAAVADEAFPDPNAPGSSDRKSFRQPQPQHGDPVDRRQHGFIDTVSTHMRPNCCCASRCLLRDKQLWWQVGPQARPDPV